MKFIKLNASFVDGSGLFTDDLKFAMDIIIELYEDKIDDYIMLDIGQDICLKILGDDTGAPLTSIYGTFIHNGKEYGISIPNDNYPVLIKIVLDHYNKEIAEKIAYKNLESKYDANDLKLVKTKENEYEWIFEIHFSGIDYRKKDYEKMKKIVKVSKEDGYDLIEDLR